MPKAFVKSAVVVGLLALASAAIAAPPQSPQLTQCIQANQRNHAEVWQLFQRARAAGRIAPAEQQQWQAMESRLNAIRSHLAQGGLTLPECQRIAQEISSERAAVQRMAASRH